MENSEIVKFGRQIIEDEIAELQQLSLGLSDNFAEAVKLILNSKGKLVIIGVGKNMPIAQKMVATLNSTGTIAQFLHAGEALHGDLGLIRENDIAIILSKSGNTAEIKSALPAIKNSCEYCIAITGNMESYLAKNSDLVLDTTVSKEADPNHLAPTSSTTMQLVLCDALAMTVMKYKNFGSDDFGKFHPGGSLGKQLLLKVEDLLDSTQKPAVDINADIKTVIQSLTSGRYGITVVLDNNEIVGVVTDGDLRRMLEKFTDFGHLVAKDIASFNPKTIQRDTLAKTALQMINTYKIGQLVVVNSDNSYAGIVDFHTLTNEGIHE